MAATSVSNSATIAPPAGVTETSGGCDNAVPPNCTGNNISTLDVPVWTALIEKTSSPASGTTVLAGQTISYTLVATVTGAMPETADDVAQHTPAAWLQVLKRPDDGHFVLWQKPSVVTEAILQLPCANAWANPPVQH